jgi:hypothetical protein
MEELNKIKHEVSDTNVLEMLESIYQLYRTCDVAKTYTDIVEKSIAEFRREERIPLQSLLMCFLRNLKENLTFPVMLRWKKRAQFLLIHDEFLPLEFSYNEWKKNVKIKDYIDVKLLTAPSRKIITTPETKTITFTQQNKEFIMNIKKKFNYDTIDKTISYILQNSTGWRLISFISRLLHGSVTLGELSIMDSFGSFVLTMGERIEDSEIKIVVEFYPYVYDLDFAFLINEVEVNVKPK